MDGLLTHHLSAVGTLYPALNHTRNEPRQKEDITRNTKVSKEETQIHIQFGKPPRLNTDIADSVEDNETQMYPSSKTRRENRIRRKNNIKCDDGEKK